MRIKNGAFFLVSIDYLDNFRKKVIFVTLFVGKYVLRYLFLPRAKIK